MATVEEIREAIRPVQDPELAISVVDLGLIYNIEVDGTTAKIDMTLTSPYCPLGPQMLQAVKNAVEAIPDIEAADIRLVWTPVYDPHTMASEDAKIELGLI